MNNNGFALLRYLKDLGEDAYLLLFRDDETGFSSHFSIKADTWDYEKWKPFVKDLSAVNSYSQAISNNPFNRFILFLAYIVRKSINSPTAILTRPPKNSDIDTLRKELNEFDLFIGSGATPAIFDSLGKRLDIFYAFSLGIEFINEEHFLLHRRSKNPLLRYFANQMYMRQARGIKNAKETINTEFSSTKDSFDELGLAPKVCQFPIVYPYEEANPQDFSNSLIKTKKELKDINSDLIIISHARHQWVKSKGFSDKIWQTISKNNHWLILAYSDFIKQRPNSNPLLIFFEYGENVKESKDLCSQLGISHQVKWLPIMQRKEILELIRSSSIGVGEFYKNEVIWGGTGWEVLSQGRPLIQGFKMNDKEFKELYGYPSPPILGVESKEDILVQLIKLYDNKEFRKKIGKESFEWFQEYNGYKSAKHLLDLLRNTN